MNSSQERPRVLCVDDEPRVVEGLSLNLRKDYEVHTALNAREGLQKLRDLETVSVVVSDMRMPGMDGATFLHHVMTYFPRVTRIVLTGEAGRDTAMLAVNKGQIFRFLAKPCPPEQLRSAVGAGVTQHRLVTAERTILQETLIGSIKALFDVLALANPVAFGRASRVKRLTMSFAEHLGLSGFWQLEAAAMLSQIGYLSLPGELVEKLYYGEKLTPEQEALAAGVPRVATNLLNHVPRLEPVMQILSAMTWTDGQLAELSDGTIARGARILEIVLEFDGLTTRKHSADVAVQTLRTRHARFGAELLDQFAELVGAGAASSEVREMPLRLVTPGMTILQDVRTQLGTLLVPKGFEVTPTFLEKIANFGVELSAERVQVLVATSIRARSAETGT